MSDDDVDIEESSSPPFRQSGSSTFSKDTPEYALLCELLRANKFTKGATPKSIWEARPEFKKFTLPKFRYGLKSAKAETGFHCRSNSTTTVPTTESSSKRKRMEVSTENQGAKDDENSPSGIDESAFGISSVPWKRFCPMHLVIEYQDTATKTPHAVALIVPPAGVNHFDSSRSTFQIVQNGTALKYTSQWPEMSMDLEEVLNKKISKMTQDKEAIELMSYSRQHKGDISKAESELRDMIKISDAFSNSIASMKTTESEVLTSSCIIPLPIKVSKKIDKPPQLLGTARNPSERVLLVDMKAEESTYKEMNTAELELID